MIAKSKHYYPKQANQLFPKKSMLTTSKLMIAKNKHQCQLYAQTNLR